MNTLSRKIIMQAFAEKSEYLKEKFGVKKIGLFGSYARGDMSDTSDIDVLVDLANPTFDIYMDLKFYLEGLFGSPVDLVMEDSIKPRLKKYIMDEVEFVQGL